MFNSLSNTLLSFAKQQLVMNLVTQAKTLVKRFQFEKFCGFSHQTDSSVDNWEFTNVTELNNRALFNSAVNCFFTSFVTQDVF